MRLICKAIFTLVSLIILIPVFSIKVYSQPVYNPGVDVIIGFSHTPGKSEQALVKAFGGKIKRTYHLVPAIAANISVQAQEALLRNPLVTGIDLDGQVWAVDVELDNSWGVKHINSGTVHSAGNKGNGVRIAIIDSGVNYNHPDLNGNYAGGYDFVDNDDDPNDIYGHGTHVAGTACAEDNNNGTSDAGVVGVSPECDLYSLRVLDDGGYGSWSDIIASVQWAVDHDLQVANLSLGSTQDPGSIVKQAFDNAEANGLFVVAAAGNSGNPAGKGNNIIYPAKYSSVLAVSATDINDLRPSWSSTGEEVELAAPGVSVFSTWNDSDSHYNPQPICKNDLNGEFGCYKYGSGTSMAAPHVAGAAALVISAGVVDTNGNGNINDEVRAVLNATARDIGAEGKDEHYGYGLVDALAAVSTIGTYDQLPVVSITYPTSDEIVSGFVLIAAVADDDNGVVDVKFYIDGIFLDDDTSFPYEALWDTTEWVDGEHNITVTVADTASQTSSDTITVVVNNINDLPIADAGPDQEKFDNDGNGVEIVTLDGSGSYDPDGSIVSYAWYEYDTYLGDGVNPAFEFTLGAHPITLIVTDDDNETNSDSVLITVLEASDIQLSVTGYKYKGLHKADLEWSGSNAANIDVYRDSVLIETTPNDGFYTDNIDQRGQGTYRYKVCDEESESVCSNEVMVVF